MCVFLGNRRRRLQSAGKNQKGRRFPKVQYNPRLKKPKGGEKEDRLLGRRKEAGRENCTEGGSK